MSTVTFKKFTDRRRFWSPISWFRIYCDYSDCCEVCDGRVRFLCRVKQRLEKIQTRIILHIIRENEKKSDVL